LYNISLSVFYLLVVNYGWKDTRIKSIEWSFHVIPLGYAIITSSFAAIADLYGYVPWTCWILPSELFDETQELTPIQSKFQIIQWIFLFGVVWVCIVVVSIIFVIIYRKMKKLEQKMTRYSYYSNNKILQSSSYFSSREISRELSRDSRDSSGGSRLEPFVISTTRPTMNNDNNNNNNSNNNNSNNNSKIKSGTTIENKAYDDSDSDTESGPQINEEGKWDQCDDIADVDVDVDVDEMKSNEEKVHTNTVVGKSDDVEDVDDDGADIENEFKKNENETRKREHEEEEEEEDDDDNMSNSSDIFEEPINDSNEEAERVAAAAAAAAAGDQKPTRSGRNLTRVSWITSAMFADRQLNETEDDHNNNNHNNHNNASAAKVATARTKRRAASKSQKIAVQGLLYVGAFYVTWLFPTISRITELTAGRNYFPIQFLDTFLLPLQGFFNFFIYIRPRYLIQRKLNQNDGFWMTLRIVAFENHD
jgi:hypothetical protein